MAKPPDIELQGVLEFTSGKAYLFHADYWGAPEWLPRSQCNFQRDELSEDPKRGVMRVAGWLASKNGWDEHGQA